MSDNYDSRATLELKKRFLSSDTIIGKVASVHLEKVIDDDKDLLQPLVRDYNKYIFKAHDVILGDFNTTWGHMIGIAPPSRQGYTDAKPKPKPAWLEDVVELASVSWGSYLPGISLSKEERPAFPPQFDQIVYRKTKGIVAMPCDKPHSPAGDKCQRIEKSFDLRLPKGSRNPRSEMARLRWPSDHMWVVAILRGRMKKLKMATWNVADPTYFGRFHPLANLGFDWQPEQTRLTSVLTNIRRLLDDGVRVLGLQEVPAAIVHQVAALGAEYKAYTEWVAAPSKSDTENYTTWVGRRGSSPRTGAVPRATRHRLDDETYKTAIAPVAHEVMMTRFDAMKPDDPRQGL